MTISDQDITRIALQCGAAKFYPEQQTVKDDNFLVGKEFLQRFAQAILNQQESK